MMRWNMPALFLTAGALLLGCAAYLAVPAVNSLLVGRFLSEATQSAQGE
jgi:hypothetical protein